MVVFQFANDIRAGKKVCYTLSRCPHRLAAKDATLSRWISRVRIPLGAPQNLRSPLPIRWRAFCYPYAGIRTRQGAELRKRASVFQRSTQGAERRSESGRRQPHADIPLGAPQNLRSPLPIRWRAFGYPYAGIRTRQVRIPASADGPCAKNSKYEYCYQFSNSDFMPSEDNLDAKRPTAEEMQAFISQVLGHMLRNSASFAKR